MAHPLSLERLSLEHRGDRELEAVLLPEDLVEVVVVTHPRVVDRAVSNLGELLSQEAVGRGDYLVQVGGNLHKRNSHGKTRKAHADGAYDAFKAHFFFAKQSKEQKTDAPLKLAAEVISKVHQRKMFQN